MTLRTTLQRLILALAVAAGLAPALGTAADYTVRVPMVTVSFAPTTQTFDFGTVAVGSRPVRTFLFSNKSSSALSVVSVSATGSAQLEANGCPATLLPGATCNVSVALPVTAPGTVGGDVRVLTNASSTPEILRVSALGAPEASFVSASPASLSFGEQAVSTTSSAQTITVKNNSTSDVYVGELYLAENSAYFSKSSTCDMYLPAGGSCTVTVRFMPRLMGATQARLVRDLEDGTQLYVASVSGTGVRAEATWSLTAANFLDVPVGTRSQPQTIGLTNTGRGALSIKSLSIAGDTSFRLDSHTCGASLASMASCEVRVSVLAPDALTRTATLRLESDALESKSSLVQLYARPANLVASLSVSPAVLDFSNVPVGSTSTAQRITLVSSGSQAVAVTSYALSGTNAADFVIASPGACVGTLQPGQQCSFDVLAKPTAEGARTASVSFVSSSAAPVLGVALRATGIRGTLVAAPTSVNFGDVNVGRAGSAAVVLSNTGSAPLQVTSAALSGAQAASFTTSGCTGQTLAAGASCTMTVSFAPTVAGTANAALALSNTGSTSSVPVSLTGRGIVVTPTANLTEFSCPTVVPFGAAASCTATLTNTGTVALPVSSVTSSVSSFPVTHNCSTSLAAGASCTLTASMTPTSAPASGTASYSSTVTAVTGAQTFTRTVALTAETSRLTLAAGAYAPVSVGTSLDATHVLTNSGKFAVTLTGSPTLGALSSSGAFVLRSTSCSGTLAVGASCNIVVGCVAPATAQTLTATLSAAGSNSAQAQAALSCQSFVPVTAGNLSSAPNPLSFGTVALGQAGMQTLTVSNRNTTALRLDSLTFSGTHAADFSVVSSTCTTLPALSGTTPGTCTIQLRFAPQAAGLRSATLRAQSSTQSLGLDTVVSGTGAVASLTATPNPANFADTALGQTVTQLVTIRNNGPVAAPLPALAQWGLTGDVNDLSFSANTCAGTTLAVNATCTLTARFAPATVGTKRATLALSTPATAPLSLSLGGTALPQPTAQPALGAVACTGTAVANGTVSCSVVLSNAGNAALGLPAQPLVGVNVDPRTVTVPLPANAFMAPRCGASLTTLAAGASCTYTFQTTALREGLNTLGFALNTSSGALYATGTVTALGASGSLTTTEHASAPGQTTYATHTLTNTGQVTLSLASSTPSLQASVSGAPEITFAGKPPYGIACGATLAPGARCELMTACLPRGAGTFTTTLTVKTLNNSPVISAPVRCVATPPSFRVEPAAALTTEAGGYSGSGNYLKVTNTGSSALTFQWLAPTSTNWMMSSTASNPSHCTAGKSLAAGASCQVLFSLVNDAPGATYTLSHRIRMMSGTTALEQPISMAISTRGLSVLNTQAFGAAQIGTAQEAVYRFTNVAPHPMTAPGVSVSSTGAFSVASHTCTGTLAPGATCDVRVRALPTMLGSANGTLTVRGSFPRYLNTVESGVGVNNVQASVPLAVVAAAPKMTITDGTFVPVRVGQTADATYSVRNDGAAALQLTRLAATPAPTSTAGGFTLAGGTCSTTSQLAVGSSCTVVVRFAPTAYSLARTPGTLAVEAGSLKLSAALSGRRLMSGTVSLSVTDNLSEVLINGTTTYSMTVSNKVADTASVVLNFAATGAQGASVTPSVARCPILASGSSCAIEGNSARLVLAPNATVSVTQTVATGPGAGSMTMNASIVVDPSVEDTSTADNTAQDTNAVVIPKADIVLTQAGLPAQEFRNRDGEVTVTVRNATSSTAALSARGPVAVRVTQQVASLEGGASARLTGLTCGTVPSGSTCSTSGLTGNLTLVPGASATLKLAYTTEASVGRFKLTSTAALAQPEQAAESTPENNTAQAEATVQPVEFWASKANCGNWPYAVTARGTIQCNVLANAPWRYGVSNPKACDTAGNRCKLFLLNEQDPVTGQGLLPNFPDINIDFQTYSSSVWEYNDYNGFGRIYLSSNGTKYLIGERRYAHRTYYSVGVNDYRVFYRHVVALNPDGTFKWGRDFGRGDGRAHTYMNYDVGHGYDDARDMLFFGVFKNSPPDTAYEANIVQVRASTGEVVRTWSTAEHGSVFAYDAVTGDMYFPWKPTTSYVSSDMTANQIKRFNPYTGAVSYVTLPRSFVFTRASNKLVAYNGKMYFSEKSATGYGSTLYRIDLTKSPATVEQLAVTGTWGGFLSNDGGIVLGAPGDPYLYAAPYNARVRLN